ILPFAAWVPIGKRNYVLDLQKKQKNPIFQIFMDILLNTNFFRAFMTSASVPSIYIQQFWNTLTYEAKTRVYSIELDKSRFILDANLLREALEITPRVYRGHDRPRYLVLQMLWGIITSSNVDYAELIWEEFVQAMHTFLTDKANLGSPTKKGKKDKAHVIPYCQFTKLIICHLGRTNNIHHRSTSPFHIAEEDLRLGNLKFVPKGEEDEHDQKVAAEKEGIRKSTSTKQSKPKLAIEKSSKPAPALKPKGKVAKVRTVKSSFQLVDAPEEEPTYSEPEPEHQGEGEEFDMERAIQMSLESFQVQCQAHVGSVAIREPVAEASRPLPVVEGKGKSIITEEQAAQSLLSLHTPKRRSTTDQFILQRRALTTEEASTGPSAQPLDDTSTNIVCDSLSSTNAETCARSDKTNSGDQDGSDPGETHESQPPPEQALMDEDQAGPDPGISRVALARPDPEPTHDEFMVDLYPKVQESLKFPADKYVILEDPLSITRNLSSMKNLEDAYAIGDQFINDKSVDDEPGKLNVEVEVVSMVIVPIYQASSTVPPLSTLVIDLSPPKPTSFTTQAPIFTATTMTTTTTLPPPPQQQSTTESQLDERVTTLENKLFDLEQKNKNLDNTTRNLGSRVYTLELRDLPHKIDEAVRENVKDAVQIALQAPLEIAS
ncbi:hypothetical protein Tco_0929424, partial [Tanacetum coccineum]